MENINKIYEFEFSLDKKRGKYWYIIAFAFIIGLVIWGFFTRQYGLSIIVMLFSGVYILLENNVENNLIKVIFTDLGIYMNNNFYEYEKIKNFSFIYDNNKILFLRLYFSSGINNLDLNINEEQLKEIKKFLPDYIELKKDDKLSFVDKLIKTLKL